MTRSPKLAIEQKGNLFSLPKRSAPYKIGLITDIHFNSHNEDSVAKALSALVHWGADILLVGGDIFDNYAASSWGKSRNASILAEYRSAREFMALCDQLFGATLYIEGNHDRRPSSRLMADFNVDCKDFFFDPLIARVIRGDVHDGRGWVHAQPLDRSYLATFGQPEVVGRAVPAWWARVGNVVWAHAELFVRGDGGVAEKTHQRLVATEPSLRDIDAVMVGHVHRLNLAYRPGIVYVEAGALCKEQDYAKNDPRLRYGSQTNGYVTFEMSGDGALLRPSVKLHLLE